MISLCCPSRGRPELAKRLVNSANEKAKYTTEFLFYLNDDDPKLEEYKDLLDESYYTVGPNQSTGYSWNQMAMKASNDIVMLMGDDVQIMTQDWDHLIKEQYDKYEDKILMVVPSDGRKKNVDYSGTQIKLWPDTKLPCGHFALHKNWISALGYFSPPFFWHFYLDTYTQKVARKINRCLYLPTVTFKAKKLFDETHDQVKDYLKISARDEWIWTKVRDRHLQADVDLLKNLIESHTS